MKQITIRNGLTAPAAHKNQSDIAEEAHITEVALLGSDYRNIRPTLEIAERSKVSVGQTLFRDRYNDEICFVSPIAGTVKAIERGARRTISRIIVSKVSKAKSPEASSVATPSKNRASIRDAMLASGLWPAFVTRPFGDLARTTIIPDAIFINAARRTPDAPDPIAIIEHEQEAFDLGLDSLTFLCDGSAHVCQSSAKPLTQLKNPRVQFAQFSGTYSAGLSGTHISNLASNDEKTVWCINYQDVIALGQLVGSGRVPQTRTISISGRQADRRSLVRVPLGSSLRELVSGRFSGRAGARNSTVLSGDSITGRPATYLGRFDLQASIEANNASGSTLSRQRYTKPIVPTAALLEALPFGAPTLSIMRALSVGDFESAASLECEAMIEEDIAPLNQLCASGADYQLLLRSFLKYAQEAQT